MNLKDTDFEKRYKVYLELNGMSKEGYRFLRPEYSSDYSDKKHFYLTYHFKKNKSRNPSIIIDSIEGKSFIEQTKIINHFRKHHALTYAAEIDGLDKITEGN